MYQKTFALTVRSLRVDARQMGPHLMRGGLGLVVLLTLLSAQQSFAAQAPGLSLFSSIIYTNAGFASFIVPMLFANAITEEKEERMLPLLQIANVSSLTILVGKSIPRMISILFIFVVQIPFSMLAITLGGVSLEQIIAGYFAVAAYVVFVAFMSLWCSVIFRLTANAIGLAGLLLFAYHVVPTVLYGLCAVFQLDPFWGAIAQSGIRMIGNYWPTNVFFRLSTILSSGFNSGFLSWQVGINLLIGLFFFLLSWASFNFFNRETDTAPAKKKSKAQGASVRRRRAWDSAIAWKEFYFAAGGKHYFFAKFVIYGSVIVFIAFADAGWQIRRISLVETFKISSMIMFFGFLPLELVLTVARTFPPEIKNKTLSALVMLPISTRRLAYTKLLGGFLGLVPVLTYSLICVLFSPRMVSEITRDTMQEPFVVLLVFSNVVAHLLLFLHLVAWMSLRMNGWWAILVAWLVHYLGMVVVGMIFGLGSMALGFNPPDWMAYLAAMAGAVVVLVLVIAIHFRIGQELRSKAAEL